MSEYRVTIKQSSAWGWTKWTVVVDTEYLFTPPCMTLHPDGQECTHAPRPVATMLQEVGRAYCWTEDGARRKARRIIRRSERDRRRAENTKTEIIHA